jgi:hypothetical protein
VGGHTPLGGSFSNTTTSFGRLGRKRALCVTEDALDLFVRVPSSLYRASTLIAGVGGEYDAAYGPGQPHFHLVAPAEPTPMPKELRRRFCSSSIDDYPRRTEKAHDRHWLSHRLQPFSRR